MGIKEKMMETMMGGMSADDKREMMDKMMDQFFGSMTAEEKQTMMKEMMPKMMQNMMGGAGAGMGGSGSMMDMMKMMMGGQGGEKGQGKNPMDMCQQMMANMTKTSEMAVHATPEIQTLFTEWLRQIEEEFVAYMEKNQSAQVEQLMEHFKLTRESVVYIMTKLAQQNKIVLTVGRKAA